MIQLVKVLGRKFYIIQINMWKVVVENVEHSMKRWGASAERWNYEEESVQMLEGKHMVTYTEWLFWAHQWIHTDEERISELEDW